MAEAKWIVRCPGCGVRNGMERPEPKKEGQSENEYRRQNTGNCCQCDGPIDATKGQWFQPPAGIDDGRGKDEIEELMYEV